MSLEGTLQILSLPNLIQLHCNQQQTVMVRLVRPEREGWLAFDKGDLVYASLGALTGEEAVYELLGWEEGEFHVSEVDAVPSPNIATPWSVLLLEGLQRVDELRAVRQSALQALLAESKGKNELRAAVIVSESGRVHADVADSRSEENAALLTFVTGRAQLLGSAMGAGAFSQLIYTQAGERGFIEQVGPVVLGCWLDPQAQLDPVRRLIQKIKEEQQTEVNALQTSAAVEADSGV